jgi:hypothetical protein
MYDSWAQRPYLLTLFGVEYSLRYLLSSLGKFYPLSVSLERVY